MSFLPDDARERHRAQRLFAFAGVAVLLALALLYWLAGLIESRAAVVFGATLLAGAGAAYAMLSLGVDRKLRDPGLGFTQLLYATLALLYLVDQAPEGRPVVVLASLMPFTYALLRLGTVKMAAAAVVFLAGYGWILWQDARAAQAMGALGGLALQWLGTALVLGWLAAFCGYVSGARSRLADSHAKLLAALERVQTLLSHDELTGLYTRRHMIEVLEREKRASERSGADLSVLMIDLDRFKSINDTHGHAAGDQVLRRFAQRARATLRPGDMLGRLGGEEFLVVCAGTNIEGAQALGERIRKTMAAMETREVAPALEVTLSVGVAQFEAGDTIEALLGRADAALYAAKQGGRNRVEVPALQARRWTRAAG